MVKIWVAGVMLAGVIVARAQVPANGPMATMAPPEVRAVAYLRTVFTAEREYFKKHHEYTKSLAELVGHGSFTKRMANPDRNDYQARYASKRDAFSIAMTPKNFDQEHRAFFVDQTGVMRVDEGKAANEQSPALK
jgi:hypothetical protein